MLTRRVRAPEVGRTPPLQDPLQAAHAQREQVGLGKVTMKRLVLQG